MDLLVVERIGGLAGFGGPGAHVRSRGQVVIARLSEADRQAVEELFRTRGDSRPSALRDSFSYRISRTTSAGSETIEVPESMVPASLVGCVKDELI